MRRALLGCVLLASCGMPGLPEGTGLGLIAVDRQIPDDAKTAFRPLLREGDRFRFLQGGEKHIGLRVARADDKGYELVDEGNGTRTFLDIDLGHMGEEMPDNPEALRRLVPFDKEWTWPLWEGKRWSSHFLRKAPGTAIPVQANYHADRWETVTVPAGTFECLRIWRRGRPTIEGRKFLENTEVRWYAPKVGYFVRRLADGVLLELQEFHRQS